MSQNVLGLLFLQDNGISLKAFKSRKKESEKWLDPSFPEFILNILKTTPIPNKSGSYGIEVGARMA